ncbi:MAG: GntR family transcriptional regulator [Chloroflexi bacterium]|nr:GntR family transcriptional regulator [Chloroflexota bacterium]
MQGPQDWTAPSYRTLQELVTDRIREAILRGWLKPGERLDQAEIAERFQVSRMPVREALRTLEAEGLVKFYPHRGVEVCDLSPEEIEEIYQIRSALEAMAIQLAVPHFNEEADRQLSALLQEMEEVADDPPTWTTLNYRFHRMLYGLSGRARLCAIIESLRNTVQPYVARDVSHPTRARRAMEEHREILAACRAGDATRAAELISQHLKQVCDNLVASLRGAKAEEA